MLTEDQINKIDIDLIKMNTPSIGYVGYDSEQKILGVIYQNHYNQISLFENVDVKIFNEILRQNNKCGVYIALYVKDNYEITKIPRRKICRTLFV